MAARGRELREPLAQFGELVRAKISEIENKTTLRWYTGIWVGIHGRSGSHIILTSESFEIGEICDEINSTRAVGCTAST